jgi:hypothetical protein
MTTFTPGPWTYEVHELSEGFSGIVYAANGMRVGTDHLSEADARLIAAAPALYEALKEAREGLRYVRERHGVDGVSWDLIDQAADAALSAATGDA